MEKIKCAQCPMLVPKSEMDSHKKMKHGPESHVRTTRSRQSLDDKGGGARKLYPCPECKVNFSSLDIMREHVKTRHKKQLEVIYKCPKSLCTYQTSNRTEMQNHQKEQHSAGRPVGTVQIAQARPAAAKPKPTSFDCQFCDFSAKSMEALRQHRSIHLQKPQEPEEDVPLDMEVTSEDVPPPILEVDAKNLEVTSEDARPSISAVDPKSMEVAVIAQSSTAVVNSEDLEVANEDARPYTGAVHPKSMEEASKEAQPSTTVVKSKDLEVAKEDARPSSEAAREGPLQSPTAVDSKSVEVAIEDACPSTAAEDSKSMEVVSEEVPTSIAGMDSKNVEVASDGPKQSTAAVDSKNMEVPIKDVSPPTAAMDSKMMEVTSEPPIGEVDSINMEVTNEDVPPPIGEVDSQED